MIFVLLGMQNNDFSRLLLGIEECIKSGDIQEEVIAQVGKTKFKSDIIKIVDTMDTNEYENHIKEASCIITHGGVGSIMTALRLKKKIIAVPRLAEYGEHVNDHQMQIVEKLSSDGYIKNGTNLKEAINKINDFEPNEYKFDNTKLKATIKEFIDGI